MWWFFSAPFTRAVLQMITGDSEEGSLGDFFADHSARIEMPPPPTLPPPIPVHVFLNVCFLKQYMHRDGCSMIQSSWLVCSICACVNESVAFVIVFPPHAQYGHCLISKVPQCPTSTCGMCGTSPRSLGPADNAPCGFEACECPSKHAHYSMAANVVNRN